MKVEISVERFVAACCCFQHSKQPTPHFTSWRAECTTSGRSDVLSSVPSTARLSIFHPIVVLASRSMVNSMASDATAVADQQEYIASVDEVRDFFAASQQRLLFEQAVEHHHGPALKSCTYDQGYIQQPLFSCLTCRGGAGEEGAGRDVALCAACAFKCHGEHELEEIYDKRHTRCDCPTLTSRSPPPPSLTLTLPATSTPADTSAELPSSAPPCTLNPPNASYPVNTENTYNHNYVGLYCHCNGRYEVGLEVMYQCSLCLDWYHDRCMRLQWGQTVPGDGEEGLLTCRTCLSDNKYDFLLPYLLKARLKKRSDGEVKEEQKEQAGPLTAETEEAQSDMFSDITAKQKRQESNAAAAASATLTVTTSPAETLPGWQCAYCHFFNQPQQDECFGCEKAKKVELPTVTLATESAIPHALLPLPSARCTRFTHSPASFSRISPPDLWVESSWQSALCKCDDCVALYRTRAPFLLNPDNEDDEDGEAEADCDEATDGSAVRSADELMDGYLSSLPRHALLEGMDAMSEWNEAVMRRLQALGQQVDEQGQAVLITGEMVRAVTREAKEEVEARRRRRRDLIDDMDGADGEDANSSKRGRYEE